MLPDSVIDEISWTELCARVCVTPVFVKLFQSPTAERFQLWLIELFASFQYVNRSSSSYPDEPLLSVFHECEAIVPVRTSLVTFLLES